MTNNYGTANGGELPASPVQQYKLFVLCLVPQSTLLFTTELWSVGN